MKILIVSNNDINTIKNVFIKFDHEVIIEKLSTMDKREEIHIKDVQNPDFVFVELELSKKTDKQLLYKLLSEFRDVPVIPIIDANDLKFAQDIFECGIADYILKPFTNEELMERLKIIVKNIKKMKSLKDKQEELTLLLEKHGIDSLQLREEVKLAKYVQKNVLGVPFEDENIKIYAKHIPSRELSGDMYQWYKIDKNRYGIILLDVMGHSISSALVGMSIFSLLRGMITRLVDPIKVIYELNKHMNNLYLENDEIDSYYFSAIYILIDTDKKLVEYVNAGHPPALAMTEKVIQMTEGSIAIGLMNEINISKGSFYYENLLRILLYTDGILDFAGETPYIGIKNMENYFKKCSGVSCGDFIDNIISELNIPEIHEDDICLTYIDIKK